MTKTLNLKDIIQEYENMTLENAITVIMDTPLSKLLDLTKEGKDIVPQLKGYKIYALQLSDIVADSGLMGDLENKVKMLINYMSDQAEKRILFIDEIHMLFQEKAYRIVAQILKPALSRGKIKLIGATTTQEANLIDSDPAFCRRMTKIIVDESDHEQTVEILLTHGKNIQTKPKLTLRHKILMTAPFTGAVIFLF